LFKFANYLILMNIIQTKDTAFRNKIIELYIESFSKGLSAQYIDNIELGNYIDWFFVDGEILISLSNNELSGALLYCPLKNDNLLPAEIKNNFDVKKCVYIAEIMVGEQFRGKGIGPQLINAFFDTVDKNAFSDAFIRVWDKNTQALSLYEKAGFKNVASIRQEKKKKDGVGTFEMKKIYLHKKIN